jgi:hypothetical protein
LGQLGGSDQLSQAVASDHIQPIGNLHLCVMPPNLAAQHDLTLSISENRSQGDTSRRMRSVRPRNLALETRRSKIMPLIQLLEVLVVVGVLLWLVNRFIPMQGTIKSILNGVVVIAVVLWLMNVFGLFHSLSRIHVGMLMFP